MDFVDLARLGRTGLASALLAALRVFGYWVAASLLGAVAIVALELVWPPSRPWVARALAGQGGLPLEMAVVGVLALVFLWGLRDAVVRTQARPFLTLVSAEARIRPRRILLGAGLWLAASAPPYAALALALPWLGRGAPAPAAGPAIDADALPGLLAALVVIPLVAATEELVFRGWLTQTLGQAIRRRIPLALVVGLVFALMHGLGAGLLALPYLLVFSLAMSRLSLADRRLELAIGAHAAQDLGLLLAAQLEGGHPATLVAGAAGPLGAAGLAVMVLQALIAGALVRRVPATGSSPWPPAPPGSAASAPPARSPARGGSAS